LKFVDAAAECGSIGFEKNKMAAPRDGTDQMRNARMIERLASANPNHRRAAGNDFANPLVGNRLIGMVMQKFSGIHKPNGA
jgi:hypothetical protein